MVELDFRKHGLPPELVQALEKQGFERFTPIQSLSVPALREGRDLLGQSQTGSGKTVAFGLPLLEKIVIPGRLVQGLVLCPTRELADQVCRTLRHTGRFKKDLLVASLVGGEPLWTQLRTLQHGAHIVVGTPGRVLDIVERGRVDFSSVLMVVLDEADRMLDMGFRDSIEKILKFVPEKRQTALFSATYPVTIEALSARYQQDPVVVKVEEAPESRPKIEQRLIECEMGEPRAHALARLIQDVRPGAALVFCNFKASVNDLLPVLRRAGLSVDKIHGDLEQFERDRVMARFRNGSTRVLVATDVAARGLDILGLDAVFNFELPNDPEIYVHRIGRTGRAGKSGVAWSFYSSREAEKILRIEGLVGFSISRELASPKALSAASLQEPAASPQLPQLSTLEIRGGRKAKLRPGDVLGALVKDCGLSAAAIGKIDIRDNVSYVAVDRAFARQAVSRLSAGKLKGRKFFVSLLSDGATAP